MICSILFKPVRRTIKPDLVSLLYEPGHNCRLIEIGSSNNQISNKKFQFSAVLYTVTFGTMFFSNM